MTSFEHSFLISRVTPNLHYLVEQTDSQTNAVKRSNTEYLVYILLPDLSFLVHNQPVDSHSNFTVRTQQTFFC